MRYIRQDQAIGLVDCGIARVLAMAGELSRRLKAIALNPPPPPPSTSKPTPTTITVADLLANVGLAMRDGQWVSRARQEAATAKIEGFKIPSWADRLVRAPA